MVIFISLMIIRGNVNVYMFMDCIFEVVMVIHIEFISTQFSKYTCKDFFDEVSLVIFILMVS